MLYLASQSPRRLSVLNEMGVQVELLLPESFEDSESLEIRLPHESGLDYVTRVTLLKLEAAKKRLLRQQKIWSPILCADTTVCIRNSAEDLIFGKPTDDKHALQILQELNGKTHEVYTAVALLVHRESSPIHLVSISRVTFENNPLEKIMAYIKSKEPFGKAGAYAIQGIGAALIKNLDGSHSGVMGLPFYETSQLLDLAGISYTLNL